jgi:hypothetical protein
MITGFFLQILLTIILWAINLLPLWAFPAAISSGFATIVSYINLFTFIFPVTHLFIIVSLAIAAEVVILVWHFGWKIIHLLRPH